jgi:hypothetical protein
MNRPTNAAIAKGSVNNKDIKLVTVSTPAIAALVKNTNKPQPAMLALLGDTLFATNESANAFFTKKNAIINAIKIPSAIKLSRSEVLLSRLGGACIVCPSVLITDPSFEGCEPSVVGAGIPLEFCSFAIFIPFELYILIKCNEFLSKML